MHTEASEFLHGQRWLMTLHVNKCDRKAICSERIIHSGIGLPPNNIDFPLIKPFAS